MKNPIKKTSTKIFVDEYDRYCQGYDLVKRPQQTQQKKTEYQRYIDHQLGQEHALRFPQQYSSRAKNEQREYPERKMTNENCYDLLSSDEEYPLSMLLERRHNKETNHKMKNIVFPQKKGEVHHRQKMYFKESQYFPEQLYQKTKKEPEIVNKEKRPNSSMANKTHLKTNANKFEKQKEEKLKKALSSSKFKEEHKRNNQSCHKEKQVPAHSRNPQTYKNNITLRNQTNSRYQDPVLNRLKKKPVNMTSKPLRIEEFPKNKSQVQSKAEHIPFKNFGERKGERQVEKHQVYKEEKIQDNNRTMKESRKRQRSERSQSDSRPAKIGPLHRLEQLNREYIKEREEREKQQIRHRPIPESHPQRGGNRQQRREPEIQQRQQPVNRNHHRRQRERQPRTRQQRPRQNERQNQRRNNRNHRFQASNARRSPNPHNFLNIFSRTINDQLELMNNQFSMMTNIFQNFSNFVNINIDSHGNHFHFSNMESSDEYTDSSDSNSQDYDDYYESESDPEGLNESELDRIEKLTYRVSIHGNNQCTICLIDLKNGDEAKKLFCQHVFHSSCIDEWLKRKSDCPVCRDKQ